MKYVVLLLIVFHDGGTKIVAQYETYSDCEAQAEVVRAKWGQANAICIYGSPIPPFADR